MIGITPEKLKSSGFTKMGEGKVTQHWRIFVREHSLWVTLNTRKDKFEVYLSGLNENSGKGSWDVSAWFHLTFPNVRGIQDIWDLERMLNYKSEDKK